MSLFKNIFGSSDNQNEISKINWNPLTELSQLDEIIELSSKKTIAIFKHSTRCSISRFALKQFENEYDLDDKMELYFLDLLNYRAISNEIAIRFGVEHQSPQLILIKSGKAAFDVSHGDINASDLKQHI